MSEDKRLLVLIGLHLHDHYHTGFTLSTYLLNRFNGQNVFFLFLDATKIVLVCLH